MRKCLLLLFAFLGSACVSPSGTSTPPLSMTRTPDLGTGNFSTPTSVTTIPNFDLALVAPQYIVTILTCKSYVETTWGNGAGQWGDPTNLPAKSHRYFFPPAFNSDGELYISDFVNRRLLKYDGNAADPIQIIPLPDHYFTFPFSSAITITKDSIIIPYGINMIGIMSLDGQVIKDIQLPDGYTYNMMAPGWYLAWVDERGGILVKSNEGIYFDVGWRDEQWIKISAGNFGIRPFSWQDYIGDMNSVEPIIQLYKINSSANFLAEPTKKVDTGLNAGYLLAGVDKEGRAYIEVLSDNSQVSYARYSISDGAKQIGIVEGGLPGQIIQSGVAPDGTIYIVMYDYEDLNVQPRIVKCRFSDN